jgi:hypothetical protein
MVILDYRYLSRQERRAARKLAKKLLRSVPPAELPNVPDFRAALMTAFMKPENVVAAFVCGDDDGHWWANIVLDTGRNRLVQLGSLEHAPLHSDEQAFQALEHGIALIKATREDSIVQRVRDMGIDPTSLRLLRVHHQEFGCRWVLMDEQQLKNEAANFVDFLQENKIRPGRQCLEFARQLVFDYAARFATDPECSLTATAESEPCLGFHAAGYLLANNVTNVDDRDAGFCNLPDIPESDEIDLSSTTIH